MVLLLYVCSSHGNVAMCTLRRLVGCAGRAGAIVGLGALCTRLCMPFKVLAASVVPVLCVELLLQCATHVACITLS